ncbi:MAG TPA: molybdenum cofactor guanylyltransferase [Candidatus Sulfotelmatobacter sp.]|nr:molybdenum cofactor guanylyltransferase [Candidatus Sulfotelmatobacter sp.]
MDRVPADLTAFILAGGKSTRMGADKAFVQLQGRTLLARALELAQSVAGEVRIVGDRIKFTAFAPVVEDVFPGCGPLAGIHAALRASQTDLNLMLAVDLPLISPELLQYLVTRARSAPASVTAARANRGWQPLCAVYRKEFADAAEQALRAGNYKIDTLFEPCRTQLVSEQELADAGISADIFRNVNTPEELRALTEVSKHP